jgi:5-methylcytosine-specific restriction protein A
MDERDERLDTAEARLSHNAIRAERMSPHERGADPGLAEAIEDLVARVARLTMYRVDGQPALYQPIALFWAVGRARRAADRLLPWSQTDQEVGDLLDRHRMRGEHRRPYYPIAALHHQGLWELPDHAGLVPSTHKHEAKLRRWFIDNQPRSGLPAQIYELLRRSGQARLEVIDTILTTYLDGLKYDELLADVGLSDAEIGEDHDGDTRPPPTAGWADQYARLCQIVERREAETHGRRVTRVSRNHVRLAAARRAVLLRCQGRCENPACTGQPDDLTDSGKPILDVDHVEDIALDGRDHSLQMVALCPNCHAVKTRGSTRERLREILLEVAQERHAQCTATTLATLTD